MVGLFYACDLVVAHTASWHHLLCMYLHAYSFFATRSRCLGGKTTVGEHAGESCTHVCVCLVCACDLGLVPRQKCEKKAGRGVNCCLQVIHTVSVRPCMINNVWSGSRFERCVCGSSIVLVSDTHSLYVKRARYPCYT